MSEAPFPFLAPEQRPRSEMRRISQRHGRPRKSRRETAGRVGRKLITRLARIQNIDAALISNRNIIQKNETVVQMQNGPSDVHLVGKGDAD